MARLQLVYNISLSIMYMTIYIYSIYIYIYNIKLTAFVGVSVLGHAVVQRLLLSEVVFVRLAVASRTRTYPPFKRPPAQDLTAVRGRNSLAFDSK